MPHASNPDYAEKISSSINALKIKGLQALWYFLIFAI
jgi:hypothetical protein